MAIVENAYDKRAQAFINQKKYREAIENIRLSLKTNSNSPIPIELLGRLLRIKYKYRSAIKIIRKAIENGLNHPMLWRRLGLFYADLDMEQESLRSLNKALVLDRSYAAGHFSYGSELLRQGDFEQGWEGYEWRHTLLKTYNREYPVEHLWKGQPISGKRILIINEQGAGDSFLFLRFIKALKSMGAYTIVSCSDVTKSLFAQQAYIDEVHGQQELEISFHYFCAIMSLPRLLKIRIDNLPLYQDYISIETNKFSQYCSKEMKLNIGIVWGGNPEFMFSEEKSCKLDLFADLVQPGVQLYSLQKGYYAGQLQHNAIAESVINLDGEINDFLDTAAIIRNLDLVITIDTSVAHLAGALGKPVWTLLPYSADWRWFRNRDDSPWYPSMKLFRQHRPGDWQEVMSRVSKALKELLASISVSEPDLKKESILSFTTAITSQPD